VDSIAILSFIPLANSVTEEYIFGSI